MKSVWSPALPAALAGITGGADVAHGLAPQLGVLSDLNAGIAGVLEAVSSCDRIVSRRRDGVGQCGFEETIVRPNGIFLVTGPTGSGKTTTLYAALAAINCPEVKIVTLEDPVEYLLEGINQVQVNTAVDLTFANALRSMLRQAPNVVMLGEIRDYETASIAINASLTGHLVFSTLHTNDAPSAVTRLTDIGVNPFRVAPPTRP